MSKMKKVEAAMWLVLAMAAGLIAVDEGGVSVSVSVSATPATRDSELGDCAWNTGISSLCTDIQLEGTRLSATCNSGTGTGTVTTTDFNLAKFMDNDHGNLVVHPCTSTIFFFFDYNRDCNFQNSCINIALSPDGRFLSSDCDAGNGTYKHNIKDLNLYLGVHQDGSLSWACTWPYED